MTDFRDFLFSMSALGPFSFMLVMGCLGRLAQISTTRMWRLFGQLSVFALVLSCLTLILGSSRPQLPIFLDVSSFGLVMSLLVQFLGTVIGGFSARYLQGEAGQRRCVAALAAVLAAVHLLLLADHWLVLIAAWAWVGFALQPLLCFYPDRAFAQLAAHKKRIADRAADGLLIIAAVLAWREVGSGSLSALWMHVEKEGMSMALHACALSVVLAVILRTALLPVHGWLIQVMEAPTPVSALLHAGVINLGGFVLILFSPLLEQAMPARVLLLTFGLCTAVVAGMVMLTRISIKVRLAWSTVAQMGFMLLECALGLYTLAALHLVGHSLYKAHAFLSASAVVRQTRLQALHPSAPFSLVSLVGAPILTISTVLLLQSFIGQLTWPWWWSVVLGLAWSPVLWLVDSGNSIQVSGSTAAPSEAGARAAQVLFGLLVITGLTGATMLAHALPLTLQDAPHNVLGILAMLGMAALYLWLVLLQRRPQSLKHWRRWSYAGFYLDEAYTRLALQLFPARWANRA